MELQGIKQRYNIIGNDAQMNRALELAMQVSGTDITVLVIGESGVGKDIIPKVIHDNSSRKHGPYIAVNCGAIPEGTVDSELFGHEKGSFTGASDSRIGYFEAANKGTIFLDEVGELPMATQAKLLRVLENREIMKVGSSKAQKIDVRVVAATNVNVAKAVKEGKFRQDLYYRLNSVTISLPPLKDRGNDITLLFRKFANDFTEKNRIPSVKLTESGSQAIMQYNWPGNIRELKHFAESIVVLEQERELSGEIIRRHLPETEKHPAILQRPAAEPHNNEAIQAADFKELVYRMLFEIKHDIAELRKEVHQIMNGEMPNVAKTETASYDISSHDDFGNEMVTTINRAIVTPAPQAQESHIAHNNVIDTEELQDENLSLVDSEFRLIREALEKHNGKRKAAASELGISERTLYRKLKEYGISK